MRSAADSRRLNRGFDEFTGHASGMLVFCCHHYRVKHDLHNDNAAFHDEGVSASDLFADVAISFVERRTGEGVPWLVYVPFNAPHFPVAGKKRNGEPNIDQAPNWAFKACGLKPDEADPRRPVGVEFLPSPEPVCDMAKLVELFRDEIPTGTRAFQSRTGDETNCEFTTTTENCRQMVFGIIPGSIDAAMRGGETRSETSTTG
ncbi:MAG: hypothetical protein ACPGXX_04110 [Planctomycetaceae bacterium]